MKSYADLIPTGLLAMLGEDDEGLMLKEIRPHTPQGWQYPQAGGFGPQNAGMKMLQKLPYIPPQHEGFAPPASGIRDLAYRPEQYSGSSASHFQLLSSQQAQAGQSWQEPYYIVGRRPLDFKGSHIPYNDPGGWADRGWDHDLRWEHQHFIKSDGSNFGFGPNGVFSESQGKLGSYAYDIPGIGGKKIRADLIDEARAIHEKQKEEIQEALNKANYQTDTSCQNADELPRYQYNLIGNNCQDYAGEIMEIAQKLARRRGVSLYLD